MRDLYVILFSPRNSLLPSRRSRAFSRLLPFLSSFAPVALKMRRLRALLNLSLLIRSPQKASSSSTMVPPFPYSPLHNYLTRSVISSFLRGFSTLPASSEPYEVGFVSGHRASRYRTIDEEEEVVRYVPVKAYFLSTRYPIALSFYWIEACSFVLRPLLKVYFFSLFFCYFSEIAHELIDTNLDNSTSFLKLIQTNLDNFFHLCTSILRRFKKNWKLQEVHLPFLYKSLLKP